jgi:hypothetical protein
MYCSNSKEVEIMIHGQRRKAFRCNIFKSNCYENFAKRCPYRDKEMKDEGRCGYVVTDSEDSDS